MTSHSASDTSKAKSKLLIYLPALIFFALAGVFAVMLTQEGRDSSAIPSALIGRTVPETPLPPVDGLGVPGFEPASFRNRITLVNVWASWCAPCRAEHPLLMDLAEDERLVIAGMNYKDSPANASAFIGELGNPYDEVGADSNGRAGIEWGVYGVPETFIVAPDGTIAWKHAGPLTEEIVNRDMMPVIERLSAE